MRKLVRNALAGLFGFGRLKTLSIVTLSHGFVAVAFFLQMGFLARILTVARFGELATAMAIAGVAEASINARGAETALAAFAGLTDEPIERRLQLTRKLFRLDFFWNTSIYAVLVAAVLIADQIRDTHSSLLLLIMLGGLLSFPWGTAKGYMTVFLGSRSFAPVEISYAATTLLGGVGLAYCFGAIGFAAALVAASTVRSVVALWVIRLSPRTLLAAVDDPDVIGRKTIWRFGASGTLRAMLVNLVLQMDLLLLAATSGPAAAGLYRAAKTLTGVTQRLSQPVWVVLKRPIIVGAQSGARDQSQRFVFVTAAIFALAGAVLLPPLIFYGDDVMQLAFGPKYRAAGSLLVWLLPGAWLMYAVTGWSGLFGSISRKRASVIGLYLAQLALFGIAILAMGTTMQAVAMATAGSQIAVALGFWGLFLRRA